MGSIDEESQFVQGIVPYWLQPPSEYMAGTLEQYRHKYDYRAMQVYDMRGTNSSLDVQGFQLVQHQSSERNFEDVERIKSAVYGETQELLRKVTGASKVHCFSHLIRNNPPEVAKAMAADLTIPSSQPTKVTVPSPAAHIDQSPAGAYDILRDNAPEEISKIREKGSRWAIINVWRPIKPVSRDPLCVCDIRTVSKRDLVEQTVYLPPPGTKTFEGISKGRTFGTVAVTANPEHKWYYVPDMKPNEVLLLKIFDSGDQFTTGTPHTSLHIPGTEGNETRNSIEIRCLVFYDE